MLRITLKNRLPRKQISAEKHTSLFGSLVSDKETSMAMVYTVKT